MNNPDVMTIREVSRFFGLSVQTVRRRIKESREGAGAFPLSITGAGRKRLWHRRDIEAWRSDETGGVASSIPARSLAVQAKEDAQIDKELEAIGVKRLPQSVSETNS